MNHTFVNLNWNWRQTRSEDKTEEYYNANISDDETDVLRCHINEIDHIYLLDSYQDIDPAQRFLSNRTLTAPTDPRNGNIYPKFFVDHSKASEPKLFSSFPIKSQLSPWLHSSCIRAITRIRNRLTDQCRSGTSTPMSTAECKDLEAYTASWEKRQNEQTNFQEFVKKQFLANVLKLIETVNPVGRNHVTEKWKNDINITRLGHYTIQTALPIDCVGTESVTLNTGTVVSQSGTVTEYNPVVSNKWCRPSIRQTETLEELECDFQSINHEALALEHKANFVLSIDVLRKLLDFPNNCIESWNIPFEIKYTEHSSYDRICFFDEVLPASYLNKAERNKKAFQWQVQSCTIKLRDCKTFCLGTRMYDKLTPDDSPVAERQDMEYKVTSCSKYVRKPQCLKRPQILRLATLDVKDQPSLRLLIGHRAKTFEISNSGQPTLINVSTKLEYQSQFGAEQMSASELIGEWCAQAFQPDSVTDRFRVDSVSGEVLSVARFSLPEIESEMLRLHKLRPHALLGRLSGILGIMSRLPVNKYMLRHSSKSGNKVMVFVHSDNKTPTSIDIPQMFAADFETIPTETISWNPIDDMEVTRVHRHAQVTPCAFPHNALYLSPTYNKKNQNTSIVSNDRGKIVKRAQQKVADRQNALASAATKKRKLVKKAKKKAKLIKAAKQKRESSIGETIDPYLVFDAKGNILVNELMSTAQSQKMPNVDQSSQRPMVVYDTPLDFVDYEKQANL